MNRLLVLDCHYLCYRAFHTMQDLSWKGKATGVVFGFLKELSVLKDNFRTDNVAFCFEHPHLFRSELQPDYKKHRRKQRTEEEKQALKVLRVQIADLHHRHLPKIGFRNVLCMRGFEADDIMAALAAKTPKGEETILVTGDADLYQCLAPNVSIYSPRTHKILTETWFRKEYGILPWQWALVKAMAGCDSDGVKGIQGIGEITALKFLRRELEEDSNAYKKLTSKDSKETIKLNRQLVELPWTGCRVPPMQEDEVTRKNWREVCEELGMKSVAGRPPVLSRKLAFV